MTTALAQPEKAPLDAEAIERVLLGGDLAKLTPNQRVSYYHSVCKSLGLNPLTKPFEYITLNGKLTLYAKRDATEQLRKLHGVSITDISTQRVGDVYIVTAKAQDRSGRTDASTGAVPLNSLKGEALANALMKAETKAKRRVTLSICGLGILDETELETIPATTRQPVVTTVPDDVDLDTGELIPEPPAGYDDWWADITAVADEGTKRLQETWQASKAEYRRYLTSYRKAEWEALKLKAKQVDV